MVSKKNAPKSLSKTAIRRRIRKYEKAESKCMLWEAGGMLWDDLVKACREKNDVNELVLAAYAALMVGNNTKDMFLEDFETPDPLHERFGRILWKPIPWQCTSTAYSTPFGWALESVARDVVRFIMAWCVIQSVAKAKNAIADSGQKHTLLQWLVLMGDTELIVYRNDIEKFKSLNRMHYTFEGIVSRIVAPLIEPFPSLRKFIETTLEDFGKRPTTLSKELNSDVDRPDTPESKQDIENGSGALVHEDGFSILNEEYDVNSLDESDTSTIECDFVMVKYCESGEYDWDVVSNSTVCESG